MVKSPTQEKLEAQRQTDIRSILTGSLTRYRGKRNMMLHVAVDLEVSDATIYRWCEDLGINIDEYRHPAPVDGGGE